jgi:hypothetical protein
MRARKKYIAYCIYGGLYFFHLKLWTIWNWVQQFMSWVRLTSMNFWSTKWLKKQNGFEGETSEVEWCLSHGNVCKEGFTWTIFANKSQRCVWVSNISNMNNIQNLITDFKAMKMCLDVEYNLDSFEYVFGCWIWKIGKKCFIIV